MKQAGLWPTDARELKTLLDATDPYELRSRGLDKQLTPCELGRVLYHLNQRRGFKSNRKSGKSKEDGTVMKGITELKQAITEAGSRTLGEFLYQIRACERIRNRYTQRKMYEEEFEQIWKAQQRYYSDQLTDDLKHRLADEVIFFQRPLKPQADLIGKCELEPEEPRCPRADWYAQRFRLLQDVNNLCIVHLTGFKEPLTKEQRQKLIEALNGKAEMPFDKIRELLGLLETQTFNLEEGKRTKLLGNTIEVGLAGVFGKKWPEIKPQLDRLNNVLLEEEDPDKFRSICQSEWNLDDKQITKMMKISLPSKYLHLSKKAIQKLLPFMEAGAMVSEAKEKAGYLRPDQMPIESRDRLEEPPETRNPIVQRALYEVRKVVHAILREYGRPEKIIIEMAREVKGSADQRNQVHWEMLKRQTEREEVKELLRKDFDLTDPSRKDVDRYRLWMEQGMVCPYSGETISQHLLFSSDVQVDHILPYSRSLDDSYTNKVVCLTTANREKGNATPYEWLSGDPDRYEAMLQRVSKFTGERIWARKRKFSQKEVKIDQCIARQLNDTRYISREVRSYLQTLGIPVDCAQGQMTAILRRHWGLDQILDHTGGFTKNRDDHRHHAIDAVVIGLTTPRYLQLLSRTKGMLPEPLPHPWDGFRDDVAERINAINVSHRVTRKVYGALHEETAYGPTAEENVFVYRKELTALKGPMVAKIQDKTIREIVQQRLEEQGLDPDNPPNNLPKEVFAKPLTMPSGVSIRRVRICDNFTNLLPIDTMQTRNGKPYRFVAPGSNHHIEIFENPETGKRQARVVSMFEAAQRIKCGEPLIQRNHSDGLKFVMSLSKNEMILLKTDKEPLLHRVQKFDVNGAIILRPHTYAGKVSDTDKPPIIVRKTAGTLDGPKVTVDPLGRIHMAND